MTIFLIQIFDADDCDTPDRIYLTNQENSQSAIEKGKELSLGAKKVLVDSTDSERGPPPGETIRIK